MKTLISFITGTIVATTTTLWFTYKPTLQDYCKDPIEAVIMLQGQGLNKGTLYVKCNGKVYESELNAVSHEYTKGNSGTRVTMVRRYESDEG